MMGVRNGDLGEVIEGRALKRSRSPFRHLRDNRERNDNQEQREESTGTSAVCKPRLPSIIVIGSRSIIVTTLRKCLARTLRFGTIPSDYTCATLRSYYNKDI